MQPERHRSLDQQVYALCCQRADADAARRIAHIDEQAFPKGQSIH